MKSIKWLSSLTVLILLSACATAPQKPDQVKGDDYVYTKQKLAWLIDKKMTEQDIVGLSIALVDDQRVVWSSGFGYSDDNNGIKANPHTIYRAGSVTKLFTATAVMQLVEQGKIDIDHPLQEYLPEFRINSRFNKAAEVTPRLIMTHHAGLPSDLINGMWGDAAASYRDLPGLLDGDYLAFEPGQVRAYSNVGYSLLGLLVERVSGMAYADYVRQHILEPSGMHQAYIGEMRQGESYSKGYYEQRETGIPALRDQPAGSLNSSVSDLARFAQLTFRIQSDGETDVLSKATLQQMQSYQDGTSDYDVNPAFGLGWAIDDKLLDKAGYIVAHDGGTPMFSTRFLTLPKHKLAVVVMANSTNAGAVVAEVAEQAINLMLESKTGIEIVESNNEQDNVDLKASDLANLPGAWASQFGWVDIEKDSNDLTMQFQDVDFNIVRRADDKLYLEYELFGLLSLEFDPLNKIGGEYRRIGDREVLVAHAEGKPHQIIAQKIKPQQLSDVWRNRLGAYQVINARGGMTIEQAELVFAGGVLQLHTDIAFNPGEPESMKLPLTAVNDSEAIVQGIGRQMGCSLRIVDVDGQSGLYYSGFLFKPIH